MAADIHLGNRNKVCFCGKKADRGIRESEQTKLNELREDKVDFCYTSYPFGICKNCIIKVRNKKPVKVGLWLKHAVAGSYFE